MFANVYKRIALCYYIDYQYNTKLNIKLINYIDS